MAIPAKIQLKRRTIGLGQGAQLLEGELAYSYDARTLYIGNDGATVNIEIGGQAFLDLLSATPGVATADKAVILDSSAEIDVWVAASYKVSIVPGAGFVKNDASGNLLFGQTGEQTDLNLTDLADATISSPIMNQYLCFDGSEWINAFVTLNNLSDVVLSTPLSGQHLEFNGFDWVNATPSSGGAVSELNDLSDVDLSTLIVTDNGAVLTVNLGGVWAQSDKIRLRQITDKANSAAVIYIEGPLDPPTITNVAPALHFKTGLFGLDDASIGATGTIDDYNLKFFTKGAGTFILQPGGVNPAAGLLGVDASGNILFAQSGGGGVSVLDDLTDVIITTPAPDSLLQFDGSQWVDQADLVINSGAATYWGAIATDDTWRMVRNGNDLSFQRRESGTYVEKAKFLPASFLTSGSCTAGSYVRSGTSQIGFVKHDSSGNFIFEDLIQPGDLPTDGYDL
ncbi:MAG: hypothetical protein QQN46_07710, partial [Nitrosopumilus sp.]